MVYMTCLTEIRLFSCHSAFYEKNQGNRSLLLPDKDLNAMCGLYCAVYRGNQEKYSFMNEWTNAVWHRAFITGPVTFTTTDVFLPDYGLAIRDVKRTDMRLLVNAFNSNAAHMQCMLARYIYFKG